MIHKKALFIEIFLLSITVAVLHYFATIFSLYWSVDWFDIMMHFLGGLLIGLISLWVFFTSEKIKYPRTKFAIFSVTIGLVLIVGLGWELWEIFVGFTDVFSDKSDTMMDLVMDTIGAVAAYIYGIKHINIESHSKFEIQQ